MNVLITGGTGFIGRAVILRLRRDGHTVTALTRNPAKAKSLLGTEATILDSKHGYRAAVDAADAVINLAGEPIIGRWSAETKRRLRSSRLDTTRALVEAIGKSSNPPRVLVSASAVGYYGNQGDTELTEQAAPGSDFLADLCAGWEAEACKAEAHGTRVAIMRIGVVLGRGAGALEKMLPAFRLGLGGPVGPGTQYVPWIHLEDLAELFVTAVSDDRYRGAFNASAPNPVRFATFAKTLGRVLHRPAILPVPSLALHVLFGESAQALLQSARAIPARVSSLGFKSRFGDLEGALSDLLDNGFVERRPFQGPTPDSAYLREHPPCHELRTEVQLAQPRDEVFAFFSRPENLGLITPPAMGFRITDLPETMGEGTRISYGIKLGPVPLTWVSNIDAWQEGTRFVDSQAKGPYNSWWHEHAFESNERGTRMTDRVLYAAPAGPIGRLANATYIGDELGRVFGYRSAIMRLRFGDPAP